MTEPLFVLLIYAVAEPGVRCTSWITHVLGYLELEGQNMVFFCLPLSYHFTKSQVVDLIVKLAWVHPGLPS